MWKDEIVQEVRRIREDLSARFDNDPDAIMRDLVAKQHKSGRKIIPAPQRRPAKSKG